MWITIVWTIWNHRNKIVFKQDRVDALEIFYMEQLNIWTWLKQRIPKAQFSYFDLVNPPKNTML